MNKSLTKGSIFECPIGPSCHRSFHMDQPSPKAPKDTFVIAGMCDFVQMGWVGIHPRISWNLKKNRIMILLLERNVGFNYWRICDKHIRVPHPNQHLTQHEPTLAILIHERCYDVFLVLGFVWFHCSPSPSQPQPIRFFPPLYPNDGSCLLLLLSNLFKHLGPFGQLHGHACEPATNRLNLSKKTWLYVNFKAKKMHNIRASSKQTPFLRSMW